MTTAYEKFRKARFFGSLDGLRALSIVGVILFHSWWGTPYYRQFNAIPVLRQGSFGVHIFFVISGFLITTLLLREQDRFGKISIRDFYMRRALRIWPLYYATIALYVVLIWALQGPARRATFFHYLPYFLTYTYTWFISPRWPTGPFNLAWTLATEEQFYAFWPLVLRFLRGAWSSAVIVAVVLLRIAAAIIGPTSSCRRGGCPRALCSAFPSQSAWACCWHRLCIRRDCSVGCTGYSATSGLLPLRRSRRRFASTLSILRCFLRFLQRPRS